MHGKGKLLVDQFHVLGIRSHHDIHLLHGGRTEGTFEIGEFHQRDLRVGRTAHGRAIHRNGYRRLQHLGPVSLGRRIHQLADFHQTLAVLHALDGDLGKRTAIGTICVLHDALGRLHAALAGAILLAQDFEHGLLLNRSQTRQVDVAERFGGLPGISGIGRLC